MVYAVIDILWDSPENFGIRVFTTKEQADAEFEALKTSGQELLDNGDYYIDMRELPLESSR